MVTSDPTSIALQLFEAKISGGGVTPFERQCIFQRKGKSDIHKMSGSRLTELKPKKRRGGDVVMRLPEVSRTEETVRRPVDVLAADWPLAPGLMPAPRPPGPAPAPATTLPAALWRQMFGPRATALLWTTTGNSGGDIQCNVSKKDGPQ